MSRREDHEVHKDVWGIKKKEWRKKTGEPMASKRAEGPR